MLADEITVDTCRMGRDGSPGQRLRVSIAGPGSLFRIRTLGPGTEAGTTDPAAPARPARPCPVWRHCARCCGWPTSAPRPSDGAERQSLAARRALRRRPAEPRRADETRPGRVVADTAAGVWWCHGEGAMLADGLWAGKELTGAVVNLSRELAPRLSVDRTKILAYREEDVERLLWQAVAGAGRRRPGGAELRLALHVRARPAADRRRHLRAGARHRLHAQWELGGDTVDATIAGCFRPDGGTLIGPGPARRVAAHRAGRGRAVRQAAHARPGLGPRGAGPGPSDALLLSVDIDGSAPWLDPVELVPLAHLVRAARRIGRSAERDRRPAGGARLHDRGRARDRRHRPGRPGPAQPRPGRLPAVAGPGQPGACCRTCSRPPSAPAGRSARSWPG